MLTVWYTMRKQVHFFLSSMLLLCVFKFWMLELWLVGWLARCLMSSVKVPTQGWARDRGSTDLDWEMGIDIGASWVWELGIEGVLLNGVTTWGWEAEMLWTGQGSDSLVTGIWDERDCWPRNADQGAVAATSAKEWALHCWHPWPLSIAAVAAALQQLTHFFSIQAILPALHFPEPE